MKLVHTNTIARTLGATLLCASLSIPALAQEDTAAAIDKLLAQIPVDSVAEREEITGRLAGLGAPGVRELCGRLKDEPLDGKVCSALHALVHAAGKPGAEDLRKVVTDVLCEILQSEATPAAKAHLLGELRLLGRTASVGAVAGLLAVPELCEPAAQALVSIGTKEAAAALHKALAAQKGPGRATVICALGRLRDGAQVPLLANELRSDDPAVRHSAVFALSETGDPAAGPVLRKAASTEDARERRHTVHCLLRYARRLAQRGHEKEAVETSRWLVQEYPDASHIRCAGLSLLAQTAGSKAFPEIIDAMASEDLRVRATARGLIASLPKGGIDMTEESIGAMLKGASPVKHAEILKLLGQFADKVGLAAVREGVESKEKPVRLAAIAALGRMGSEAEVAVLLGILDGCERGSEEYRLAESALVGLPGDEATVAVVAAMRSAEPALCTALLRVLAARDVSAQIDTLLTIAGRHEDKAVRVGAIEALKSALDRAHVPALIGLLCRAGTSDERRAAEKVLVAAWRRVEHADTYVGAIASGLSNAPQEARLTLLRLLGVVGGEVALGMVAKAARAPEDAVRESAIRTLCKWKGTGALASLRAVADEPRNEKEAILALRGIIEIAASLEPEATAVETLVEAMRAAKRPEEKRMVLGQLASFGSVAALDVAAGCLEDGSVQREAAQSCRAIVLALDKSEAGQRKELLEKLAASSVDELAGAAAGKLVSLESDAYARINFQPRDSAVPEGWLADTGLPFGDRGNGHSYGWDKQNGETRKRGSHDDKRYATLNHIQKGGARRWEIAMPNGTYWLRVICGDADHTDQVNHLDIEGKVRKDADGQDRFDEYEVRAVVSDGRLTIAPGSGANNAKLCFIEIRSLDTR